MKLSEAELNKAKAIKTLWPNADMIEHLMNKHWIFVRDADFKVLAQFDVEAFPSIKFDQFVRLYEIAGGKK